MWTWTTCLWSWYELNFKMGELWVNWEKIVFCFIWNLTKTCSLLQKIVLNSWHHFWILQFTLHNAIHIAYFISEARMYPTISDISDKILYWILVCICSSCFHFSPGFLWQPLQLVFQSILNRVARFFLLLIKCGSKHVIPRFSSF